MSILANIQKDPLWNLESKDEHSQNWWKTPPESNSKYHWGRMQQLFSSAEKALSEFWIRSENYLIQLKLHREFR